MTTYAIGDIQGCHDELRALLAKLAFRPDRDRLWLAGDLVNRGPRSVETLRFVRAMGDNVVTVLGNHDLHLLALTFGKGRKTKSADTIGDVLAAPDRDALLEWLLTRPLVHFDEERGDLLVHAGVVPQWSASEALAIGREVEQALAKDARGLFDRMYGDQPDRWRDDLTGTDRLRFAINALTRMRVCTQDGRVDLKMKGPARDIRPPFRPWFEWPDRRSRDVRVIFGHWSALGFVKDHGVIGLDTGCVWGGALTAIDLEAQDASPISMPCPGYQPIGD